MLKEPNVKDRTLKNLTDSENEFLHKLRAKIRTDDEDRSQWKLKIISSNNQRLGVKRVTNYPYPGAPNIPLPETDKLIKKQIPNLVLSSWGPKKLATVRVEQGCQETDIFKDQAKKCEKALNMVLRTKMNLYHKLQLAADYAKEKGHCIFRVVEDFKTRQVRKVIDLNEYPPEVVKQLKQANNDELKRFIAQRFSLDMGDDDDKEIVKDVVEQFRSGKEVIEFDVEEISSLPNIEVPMPTKVLVPAYVTDINQSPRITYEYYLTRYEIEERMEQGIFIKRDMEDLSFVSSSKDQNDQDVIEQTKGWNEGITDNTSSQDLYKIQEICTWYKAKGWDHAERWVYTVFADVLDPDEALLKKIPFPFEFEGWNYEKFDNEVKDERYYSSRGVPEQVRALQEIMERCVNNLIMRDEMNNNPTYEVVDTSGILDMHQNFMPGEMLSVKAIGAEIRRLNDPITVDVSSERLMQLLKAYVEEYQNSADQLFRNATNAGGGKTLGEIQQGIQQTSAPVSVEVTRWNEILGKVYTKVFQILKERLGDSIFIDGQEITREDFNFPAEIRANGQLEMADQDRATSKAWNRLAALLNPALGECVNAEDRYNAIVDWLEKDGVKDPDLFCTNPQQIAQQQIAQMQQALQQGAMQIQGLQKQIEEGTKQLAKIKENAKEEVKKTEGKLEAMRD